LQRVSSVHVVRRVRDQAHVDSQGLVGLSAPVVAVLVAMASSTSVMAQGESMVEPPSEFSGRLVCAGYWDPGVTTDVVIGRVGDQDLIRRETRDNKLRLVAVEMTDPRLDGDLSQVFATDEFLDPDTPVDGAPGPDFGPYPAVTTSESRLQNEAGAWSGQTTDLYWADAPIDDTEWGTDVLTGEGPTRARASCGDRASPVPTAVPARTPGTAAAGGSAASWSRTRHPPDHRVADDRRPSRTPRLTSRRKRRRCRTRRWRWSH
jgi:hypothetical protein